MQTMARRSSGTKGYTGYRGRRRGRGVLAAVLVGVLLFGGKGNAEKPDDPAVVEPDPAPTTPLTLDQTTLNLNQAETATLTVTVADDVLWTSSDTNVATVDDTGLVTAGIPGTATSTVTTADGS